MNCDDFLPAIETGGVIARLKARRHAARCQRCAALYARLTEVKRQWSNAAPLSPRERQLWKSAAAVQDASASSGRNWIVWGGGLAAAGVCVAAFFVVRWMHPGIAGPHGSQPPPVVAKVELPAPQPVRSDVTVTELVPAREFETLADDVDRLDADLARLRRDAQRLEARQQLAMTLERFGTW